MKRFLLFIFCDHYPFGGIRDIYNSYDSLDEVVSLLEAKKDDDKLDYYKVHIFDRKEGLLYDKKGKKISLSEVKTSPHGDDISIEGLEKLNI